MDKWNQYFDWKNQEHTDARPTDTHLGPGHACVVLHHDKHKDCTRSTSKIHHRHWENIQKTTRTHHEACTTAYLSTLRYMRPAACQSTRYTFHWAKYFTQKRCLSLYHVHILLDLCVFLLADLTGVLHLIAARAYTQARTSVLCGRSYCHPIRLFSNWVMDL